MLDIAVQSAIELRVLFREVWANPAKLEAPAELFATMFQNRVKDVRISHMTPLQCQLVAGGLSKNPEEIDRLVREILREEFAVENAEEAAEWEVLPKAPEAMLRVTVVFDSKYVLEHREDEILPVDAFAALLEKRHGDVTIKYKGLDECVFLAPQKGPGDGWPSLVAALLEEAGIPAEVGETKEAPVEEPPTENISQETDDEEESEAEEKEEKERPRTQLPASIVQAAGGSRPIPKRDEKDAMTQIEALIGAEPLKALAREIRDVAPLIRKRKTEAAFATQSYLFSIGDGCGLTTCLELLSLHIQEMGLFQFDGARVREMSAGRKPEEVLEAVSRWDSKQQMFCIDLSGWMGRMGSREFRFFLQELSGYQENKILAFRVPFLDEATREDLLRVLSDVLFVREVAMPPFSMQELRCHAESLLAGYSLTMEEESWKVFEEKLVAEKSDGCFYGLRTVKKVVDEIIYRKNLVDARSGAEQAEDVIRAGEIASLVGSTAEQGSAMEQLDRLVGIGPIRERILEVLAQIEIAKKSPDIKRPSLHMRFLGGPGTGKTTVARIMGQLFKERGVLSKGLFFEYAGRDFCGQYVGETAPKTAAMCRDAYGSVLFIDEAYSLYRGNRGSNDYGLEAIDTLIAQMENHRDDLLVIMAGYEEDMDILMQANAGLASRMPYAIYFPNYNREDLFGIFMSMVKGKFDYEAGFETAAKEYFNSIPDDLLTSKEFSNARFVRNLFERTWGKAATRRQMEPDAPFMLMECDFDKAVAEREFTFLQQRKQPRIGFTYSAGPSAPDNMALQLP